MKGSNVHYIYVAGETYVEDEYHMVMKCDYFKELRTKYIKPHYFKRPSVCKFVDL